MEGFYVITATIIAIAILIVMAYALFSTKAFKDPKNKGKVFHKIVLGFAYAILSAFTAFVSWIILMVIGIATSIIHIGSTYGTPIYRPKTK